VPSFSSHHRPARLPYAACFIRRNQRHCPLCPDTSLRDTPAPDRALPPVTRFAPSPTGDLHLGHAYAALFAWRHAGENPARFRLRIEDIDSGRSRPAHAEAIQRDLAWLGIETAAPVLRQSARADAYRAALDRLDAAGLLYPCFCTRADIRAEIDAAGAAPHLRRNGPDGPLYPGTCRDLDSATRRDRIAAGDAHALRLDVARAAAAAGPLAWTDRARGEQRATPELFGDVVLARKDVAASYHLAVTVDDAAQGVTLVTRADDLLPATHLHRLLQALLDLPVPLWHHHPLLTDDAGRRLAKRDRAQTLRSLREAGVAPGDIWGRAVRHLALQDVPAAGL
jgi:glutamyl-Q tRNA(Asp) synthetase